MGALDCDGPINMAIFAIPALFICGSDFVVNDVGWRNRAKCVLAIACAI